MISPCLRLLNKRFFNKKRGAVSESVVSGSIRKKAEYAFIGARTKLSERGTRATEADAVSSASCSNFSRGESL
jgi:hypothetical protein